MMRDSNYRERALKMYPWICGRCAREFTGKKLSALEVHHKDHNHDNNPDDGSNWELLCIYCHDNEHARYLDKSHQSSSHASESKAASSNPFKDLANLLNNK